MRIECGGWLLSMVALLTSCGAPPPVDPQQQQAEELRLLSPFLAAREVGCGELLVELTANFHDNVGQPAIDKARHTVARENGDGYVDTVWTNRAGTADAAFEITIGETPELGDRGLIAGRATRFRVVNQLRLRVYEGRRGLTLNATAGGAFLLVKEAAGKPRDVQRFAIVDGILKG
jgi:hypothetical protein